MPRPRPRLPPVTSTLRIGAGQLAGGADRERIDELYRRWHLVWRQMAAAGVEDRGAQRVARAFLGGAEHHLGGDDGTGERVLARLDERHAHGGVAVDDGFDLLGMHLVAADIDDAAAPAGEIAALAALLDDIAGVDEAVCVAERRGGRAEIAGGGAGRADAQRAVRDLHLDLAAPRQDARGKAGEAVIDFERDPRLGGRESMAYRRGTVANGEMVEDRLVGDLARETDVARRDPASRGAHQGAAPVRRRTRNRYDAGLAGPRQKIGDVLGRARQHQGTAAQRGPQKDLEAAVAAEDRKS